MLISLFAFISCEREDENPVSPSVEISPAEIEVSRNANTFGFNLYRELSELSPDSNVIIFPFSVSMALAMAYSGANGATRDSMKKVPGFENLTDKEMNLSFKNLVDYFLSLDTETVIKIANSIWKDDSVPVLQSFINLCQDYFYSEYREIDFSDPEALDLINGWIAENTEDKIKDALDRIDPWVVLYINTVYFEGV